MDKFYYIVIEKEDGKKIYFKTHDWFLIVRDESVYSNDIKDIKDEQIFTIYKEQL